VFERMVLFGCEGDVLSNIRLQKMHYEELQALKLRKIFFEPFNQWACLGRIFTLSGSRLKRK
jgi:hypothetical protein